MIRTVEDDLINAPFTAIGLLQSFNPDSTLLEETLQACWINLKKEEKKQPGIRILLINLLNKIDKKDWQEKESYLYFVEQCWGSRIEKGFLGHSYTGLIYDLIQYKMYPSEKSLEKIA